MTHSDFPIIALSRNLYSSSRLLIQKIQLTLNEFGLTYPQFLVLAILWEKDELKVHELGKELSLDSGTLTPLLKKLESQNLLKRKRGEADERTVAIHLTYPGKSLQAKTLDAIKKLENELGDELGKEVQKLLPSMEGLLTKLSK
ncbi:MarR family winged helix-turn-helix transcriptional regulator [Algoriphagus litoralis]|uniref:MarR family winged helix-turn-helix transcriptional regulator n=1 Tax=Algoriphagus litoralis TaxID=2202829 RepID=UPI000DBAC3B6|nr:MarR family transcriptional regulator [Algoriphagus litoralis]